MADLVLPVDRAALLLVELQNDIVHEDNIGKKGFRGVLAAQVRKREVLPKVRTLIDAAHAGGVPVGYVNYARKPDFPRPNTLLHRRTAAEPTLIEGTWGAETHPRVAPAASDFVFTRCVAVDGSYGTQMYPVLRMLKRDALLICGVSTNLAVEGIVRASVNRGFEMFVIEDCCAGFPDEWHEFSIRNIMPLLATVTSSEAVHAALASATTPSPLAISGHGGGQGGGSP
jgi:nicotinamidase-related amidase